MGFSKKNRDRVEFEVPVKRWPYDFTTDDIKSDLGDFEQRYLSHCTGVRVSNEILGCTYQGIVDFCEDEGALNKTENGYSVNYQPYHNWWIRKYNAMIELRARRDHAKRMELKDLEQVVESFPEAEGADDLPF